MTIYELPGERPELTLVGPDDANFWRMLGLPADGRHALVIGSMSHPTAATVLTGTRPDIHRYLDTLGQGPDSAGLFRDMVDINQAIRNALTEDERADLWPPAKVEPFTRHAHDPVVGLTKLPHSGLQVPHTDLTVTGYKGHQASDGEAFTAKLRLHNKIVGTVENSGTGGATMFYPAGTPGFGWRELEEFVKTSRDWADYTLDQETVLDALVGEAKGTKGVTAAVKKGQVPIRMVTETDYGNGMDWHVSQTGSIPVTPGEMPLFDLAKSITWRRVAVELLNRQCGVPAEGERWELWTGKKWEPLTDAA